MALLTKVTDTLVRIKSSLAGAIERILGEKLDERMSVKDFGAKGDGVTIDTPAFELAYAVCPEGVFVPKGNYLLPADVNGKFYGPGKRLSSVNGDPVPFANVAQSNTNLIFGYDAGKNYVDSGQGNQLVLVGSSAGRNITSGTNVVALGVGVLSGDTLVDAVTDTSPFSGTEVIGIGINACKKAITANNIIGIGRDALNENKFGQFNNALGMSALQQLHTGSNNSAFGRAAGMRLGMVTDEKGTRVSFHTCDGNTFLGSAAGREVSNGNYNTFIGTGSGRGVTSTTNPYTGTMNGDNNTALGVDTLNAFTSGNGNLMLGARAGRRLPSGDNNIFIGIDAGAGIQTYTSNMLLICNHSSVGFIQGNMAGANSADNWLRVDANFQPAMDNARTLGSSLRRWTTVFAVNGTIVTSDGRYKDIFDIDGAELAAGLELASKMVKFRWKNDQDLDDKFRFGVIAQEVMLVLEKHGLNPLDYAMVVYDEEADTFGVNYGELSCFCIAALAAK